MLSTRLSSSAPQPPRRSFGKLLILPIFLCGILLLFSIGGFVRGLINKDTPVSEGENVFNSTIYSSYREELGSFVKNHPYYEAMQQQAPTPFNQQMQTLLVELDNPSKSPLRLSHGALVNQLRYLAQRRLEEGVLLEEAKGVALLDDLLRWIYTEARLLPAMEYFLFNHVQEPTSPIGDYLLTTTLELKKSGQFRGLEHETLDEDGFLHGNLPSRLFTFQGATVTRMSVPLMANWIGKVTVDPLFKCFVKNQKKHLYVNLMKRHGVEAPLARAIEALEKELPSLSVISLDKNSPFYWQEETGFPEELNSEEFKQQFLDRMFAPRGDYFWSSALPRAEWKEELAGVMDQVHARFYPNVENLTRQERRDFIELTYLQILKALVEKWAPLALNITCRQGMDRAPSLAVLWWMEQADPSPKEIAAALLTPPLLIHNRPSHLSRIERFVTALSKLKS